jgi:hypothetical protein
MVLAGEADMTAVDSAVVDADYDPVRAILH